ncbi:MAG TPA: hypothetical protein VFS64_08270 [Solirubrobacterales bacterium]|nr:hypothetical protein [Solirubrobacterales bacterium]
MRALPLLKLPLLLVLLLLSLMLATAAASAHAASLPIEIPGQATALALSSAEEDEAEGEASEGEGEGCETEGPEDEEPCEAQGEDEEADECLLEEAGASVVAVPGADLVRLTVRYRALEPTAVDVDAKLHGAKGSLHLGSERVRFHRAGVYRASFHLGPRRMPKALAAREFEIGVRPVGAPAGCALDLTARESRRAR